MQAEEDEAPPPRRYCPGCQPNIDPVAEYVIVDVCWRHIPAGRGSADARVTLSPANESTAPTQTNRAWCDLIHRGILPLLK